MLKIDYPLAATYKGPAEGVEIDFRAPVEFTEKVFGKVASFIKKWIEKEEKKMLRIELKKVGPEQISPFVRIKTAPFKLIYYYTAGPAIPWALIGKIAAGAIALIAGATLIGRRKFSVEWVPATAKEIKVATIAFAIPASLFALALLVRR